MSQSSKPHIAYAHPSHEEFNQGLEQRRSRFKSRGRIEGPWLSNETLQALPRVGLAFDLNRDPYVREQLLDQIRSAQKQREDRSGRGSGMIEKDGAAPRFHPTDELSREVDRQHFKGRWLAEQTKAVMAKAVVGQRPNGPSHSRKSISREPSW